MTVQDDTSGMREGEAFFARLDALGPRVPPPEHSHAGWEVLFAETEVIFGKPAGGDGAVRAAAHAGEATDHDTTDQRATDGKTAAATTDTTDAAATATAVNPDGAPDLGPGAAAVPPSVVVSGPMRALVVAVSGVAGQDPTELPAEQALWEARLLIRQVQRLRTVWLGRVSDVETRKLHRLQGAGSAAAWVAQQQTSLDRTEVALARRLSSFTLISQALRTGGLAMSIAARLAAALVKLRRHLDRPDGLIDGQDGERVLTASTKDKPSNSATADS